MLSLRLIELVQIISAVSVVFSSPTNRTIDDQYGDSVTHVVPTYFPPDQWNQGAVCDSCGVNRSNVDLSQVFNGTWHDTTYSPEIGDQYVEISMTFTGIAVWVYHLIANSIPPTRTDTNLKFYIDSELVSSYIHSPDSTSTVMCNVLVYHNETLTNTSHNLSIRADGPNDSLILFDRVVYTVDDGAVTPPESSGASSSNPSSSTPESASTSISNTPTPSSSDSSEGQSASSTSPVTMSMPSVSSISRGQASGAPEPGTSTTTPSAPPTPEQGSTISDHGRASIPSGAIAGIAVGCTMTAMFAGWLLYRLRKCIFHRRQQPVHVNEEGFFLEDGCSGFDTAPTSTSNAFATSTVTGSILGRSAAGATIGLHEPAAGQPGGVPIIRIPKPPLRPRAALYQPANPTAKRP